MSCSLYLWSHTISRATVTLLLHLMQLNLTSKDMHMHCRVLCTKGEFKREWLGIVELYNNYQSEKIPFG